MLSIIKVLVSLALLIKASLEDLRSREIDDRIWIAMVSLAIPLNVIDYFLRPFDLTFAFLQFAFVFILANMMYYLLNFGGADCKALISLSVMFPYYPKILPFTVKGFVFAFSVLTNAVIFAPFISLYFFFRNLVKGDVSKLMFIGYRVKVDEIPKFHNLLEFVEDGKIVRTCRGIEFDDKIVEDLKRLGVEEVWVTPALPFIIFLTVGFVMAVTVGDVVFAILNAITL